MKAAAAEPPDAQAAILRNTLVVAEIALAVVVLIGAGLLMRSFVQLRSVNPGFQPAGILTVRVPSAAGAIPPRNAASPFFSS